MPLVTHLTRLVTHLTQVAALVVLLLNTAHAACPVTGQGGDPEQNALKNRLSEKQAPDPVAFDAIANRPVPDGVSKRLRSKWSATTRDAVAGEESTVVQAIGFLLDAALEGPEHTNCNSRDPTERDVHMWLAADPTEPKAAAVVIELTPRARSKLWTMTALRRVIKSHARVRVTGWLMLDPEHPEQVGKTRATLWEIHPVTALEVMADDDSWQPLGN